MVSHQYVKLTTVGSLRLSGWAGRESEYLGNTGALFSGPSGLPGPVCLTDLVGLSYQADR